MNLPLPPPPLLDISETKKEMSMPKLQSDEERLALTDGDAANEEDSAKPNQRHPRRRHDTGGEHRHRSKPRRTKSHHGASISGNGQHRSGTLQRRNHEQQNEKEPPSLQRSRSLDPGLRRTGTRHRSTSRSHRKDSSLKEATTTRSKAEPTSERKLQRTASTSGRIPRHRRRHTKEEEGKRQEASPEHVRRRKTTSHTSSKARPSPPVRSKSDAGDRLASLHRHHPKRRVHHSRTQHKSGEAGRPRPPRRTKSHGGHREASTMPPQYASLDGNDDEQRLSPTRDSSRSNDDPLTLQGLQFDLALQSAIQAQESKPVAPPAEEEIHNSGRDSQAAPAKPEEESGPFIVLDGMDNSSPDDDVSEYGEDEEDDMTLNLTTMAYGDLNATPAPPTTADPVAEEKVRRPSLFGSTRMSSLRFGGKPNKKEDHDDLDSVGSEGTQATTSSTLSYAKEKLSHAKKKLLKLVQSGPKKEEIVTTSNEAVRGSIIVGPMLRLGTSESDNEDDIDEGFY